MYSNPRQPVAMQERYKELPPTITELFEFGTVDVVIDNLAREFALGDEQKEALRMEVELVLYLFLPRKGFVDRLQESLETDRTKTEQLASKVEEHLFTIIDDMLTFAETQLTDESDTEVDSLISTPLETSLEQGPNKATETPQEEHHTNVKPLRTFADDVEFSRAHGYGSFRNTENQDDEAVHRSSQDDIIKK